MTIQASSYIKVAVIYVLFGMIWGMQMGAAEDFKFVPVHAHINLLGWASMALYGLVFKAYPAMAEGRAMTLHFWAANAGVILLSLGIFAILSEFSWAIPVIMVGEVLTVGAMVWFGVLAFRKT